MFTHEKLTVYQDAVAIQRKVIGAVSSWSHREAVVDQFVRASESIALNIATGTSLRTGGAKLKMLDYAMGSTLESAACCDIAFIKELLTQPETNQLKNDLTSIANRIVGLRKSWAERQLRESDSNYVASKYSAENPLFWHEKLDVYGVGLQFVKWFFDVSAKQELGARQYRLIDAPACSLVLNIAEGNGRFTEIDHRRFLDMAKTAAVKAAAGLDVVYGNLDDGSEGVNEGKKLLERCVSMLVRLGESLERGAD